MLLPEQKQQEKYCLRLHPRTSDAKHWHFLIPFWLTVWEQSTKIDLKESFQNVSDDFSADRTTIIDIRLGKIVMLQMGIITFFREKYLTWERTNHIKIEHHFREHCISADQDPLVWCKTDESHYKEISWQQDSCLSPLCQFQHEACSPLQSI